MSVRDRHSEALRAVLARLDEALIVDVALGLDELTAAALRDAVDASRRELLLDAIASAATDGGRTASQRQTALWLLADPCAAQSVLAVARVAMERSAPAPVRHAALDTLDRMAFARLLSPAIASRVDESIDDSALAGRWAKALGSTGAEWSVSMLQRLAQRWPAASADVALAMSRLVTPGARAAGATLRASVDDDPAMAEVEAQIEADAHLRSALGALDRGDAVAGALVDALIGERRFALLEKLLVAGLIPVDAHDALRRLGHDHEGWTKSQRQFARRIAGLLATFDPSGAGRGSR